MRVAESFSHRRPGRAGALVALSALGLLLAGCAGIDGSGGGSGNVGPMGAGNAGGQGLFGSSMETTTVAAAPRGEQASGALYTPPESENDFSCPRIEVRGGAAAWQVTDNSDGGMRYQATLGQFSRECRYSTPDMTMRVGIQGRVLLGAKGGPGKLNVPIRLALVEEGPTPKPVWTKFYSVPVEIGEGVMQVDFGLVASDVTFPRPAAATLDRYVMYVGFDPQGATEAKPARQRPAASASRPRPARPAAASQAAPARSPAPAPAAAAPAPAPAEAPAPSAVRTVPAPAPAGDTQWIGAPAPSSGGFSQ